MNTIKKAIMVQPGIEETTTMFTYKKARKKCK